MAAHSALALLLLLACIFVCVGAEERRSYRAAVVEHAPISVPGQVTRQEAVAVMNENLDMYEQHVASAVADGAEIIVFNEDGLYGDDKCTREEILPYLEYIPDPSSTSEPLILCDSDELADFGGRDALLRLEGTLGIGGNSSFTRQPILRRLSCMAQTYGIVIVADMGDIQPCQKGDASCPADHRYQFNTQVAIDETGALLAKYHKTHLFYEPQFNAGIPCQPETFVTSFGVRFAMMICFDMMFGYPSLDYVTSEQPVITDMVYSTWWLNTPPKFSASQVQQAYSREMGMNLLASGNGNGWLYSGSGIFSEGRVLQQHYNPTGTPMDKLLVSDVPIIRRENFTPVPTTDGESTVTLISGEEHPICPSQERERERRSEDVTLTQPLELALHCPMNSSDALSSERTQRPFFGPEMLLRTLGSREDTHEYPYGNVTLSDPFAATWGAENITASATAGNLTCTARVSVASAQPYLAGKEAEIYVVYAYEGWYDGAEDFYQERFCAVYRCLTEESCYDYLIYAHTIFSDFRIEGNFAAGTNLMGMAASDLLYLVEDSAKLQVGFDDEAAEEGEGERERVGGRTVPEDHVGYIQAVGDFDTILLNASLLGRNLDQDDSDEA